MYPFFPGFTQFETQKTFTKVDISQELSGIVQDKNIFWRYIHRPDFLRSATSAKCQAKLAIFWKKIYLFCQKTVKLPNFKQKYVGRKWPEYKILVRNIFSKFQSYCHIPNMYKSFYMSIYETKRLSQNFFQKNCSKIEKKFIFFQSKSLGKNWKFFEFFS